MSEYIWRDCKKQPPLVDDGELVLMDSKNKFWVGFCKITSDGVSYFANNADPLKNDFVKYARIEKLLALETELERTSRALELAITGLKNCKTREHIGAVCRTPEYVDKILEQITALEQKD